MTEPTKAEIYLEELDSDIEDAFEVLEEFADRMADIRKRMAQHKPVGEYAPTLETVQRAMQLTRIQEMAAAVLDGSFRVISSPKDVIDVIMSQVDELAKERDDDLPEDKPN